MTKDAETILLLVSLVSVMDIPAISKKAHQKNSN